MFFLVVLVVCASRQTHSHATYFFAPPVSSLLQVERHLRHHTDIHHPVLLPRRQADTQSQQRGQTEGLAILGLIVNLGTSATSSMPTSSPIWSTSCWGLHLRVGRFAWIGNIGYRQQYVRRGPYSAARWHLLLHLPEHQLPHGHLPQTHTALGNVLDFGFTSASFPSWW